ncbi:hypothetical protein H9Q13_07935 [Pontibacter sp. JH31]|uniref:histidine kinase n=1 Tax=Pontibacter aquaedesilientis TaxID=2766980 RepID=A0ABR7XFN2_9BACT|nr:hypothetical protein [Pontibacter aquaedesilientis]MBD1397092.1 hypothetical protein [Pontibacter aquaedesilientis]
MEENQIYRVTYEAFSKFSNSLSRCRSFEEVANVLRVNLKFLFNYHCVRISFQWEEHFAHFTISMQDAQVEVLGEGNYMPHEKQLLSQKRPLCWNNQQVAMLPLAYQVPTEEQTELWGWVFENQERCLLVSLLAGQSKPFTKRDVTFVRLMAESLESKLLELFLFQELDKRNEEISYINAQQQEVIKQRTSEITKKNERLLEISIASAHQMREPLSRVLGLVQIMGQAQSMETIQEQVLPRLSKSATDLDTVLREVIDNATGELIELGAD